MIEIGVYQICRHPDWHTDIWRIGSADSQIKNGVSGLQTARYGCIYQICRQPDWERGLFGSADSQIFLSSLGLCKLLINVQGAICTTLMCSWRGINMLCWTTWMRGNKVNCFSLYLTLTCQLTSVVEVGIMELYGRVNQYSSDLAAQLLLLSLVETFVHVYTTSDAYRRKHRMRTYVCKDCLLTYAKIACLRMMFMSQRCEHNMYMCIAYVFSMTWYV